MSSIPEAQPASDAEAERIHPLAAVDPRARLQPDTEVGPFAVVGPEVVAQPGVVIGPHAVLDGRVELGRDVRISPFACVGTAPQDRRYRDTPSGVRIGAGAVVREYVTINRGTGLGWTHIGEHALIMANSHVAHDCHVGDRVVMANGATLAGHVTLDDDVTLGGLVAVHQHTRVGRLAFLAGGAMVERDVPPYCRVAGDRARLCGLNLVGLRRAGLDASALRVLRAAYRALFRTREPLAQALASLRSSLGQASGAQTHVRELLDFVTQSERGICR